MGGTGRAVEAGILRPVLSPTHLLQVLDQGIWETRFPHACTCVQASGHFHESKALCVRLTDVRCKETERTAEASGDDEPLLVLEC